LVERGTVEVEADIPRSAVRLRLAGNFCSVVILNIFFYLSTITLIAILTRYFIKYC
jgi:hypothetical protein